MAIILVIFINFKNHQINELNLIHFKIMKTREKVDRGLDAAHAPCVSGRKYLNGRPATRSSVSHWAPTRECVQHLRWNGKILDMSVLYFISCVFLSECSSLTFWIS